MQKSFQLSYPCLYPYILHLFFGLDNHSNLHFFISMTPSNTTSITTSHTFSFSSSGMMDMDLDSDADSDDSDEEEEEEAEKEEEEGDDKEAGTSGEGKTTKEAAAAMVVMLQRMIGNDALGRLTNMAQEVSDGKISLDDFQVGENRCGVERFSNF